MEQDSTLEFLRALREMNAAGMAPQKSHVSSPAAQIGPANPMDKANERETPMSRILGLLSMASDPGNISTAGAPVAFQGIRKFTPTIMEMAQAPQALSHVMPPEFIAHGAESAYNAAVKPMQTNPNPDALYSHLMKYFQR